MEIKVFLSFTSLRQNQKIMITLPLGIVILHIENLSIHRYIHTLHCTSYTVLKVYLQLQTLQNHNLQMLR